MLRDNITLELLPGAVIFASEDSSDYPEGIYFKHVGNKKTDSYNETRFAALLCCKNASNVTIRGGLLAANDIAFFIKKDLDPDGFEPALQAPAWYGYKVARERVMMLLIENSKNVTVEDLRIEDYPAYAVWALSSENIRFNKVSTKGKKYLINTDGLHIASCKNVTISSCILECGDDCIAIDANEDTECRDIAVTGCVFDTSVHAIRVYTGIDHNRLPAPERIVRNVVISSCTVTDAAGVFNVNAEDGIVENVSITNVNATASAEGTSFLISTKDGSARNIRISGLTVIGNGCGMIHAGAKGEISGVRIYDSDFVITPKTKLHAQFELMPLDYPKHCHFYPSNFYFKRATDVMIKDVTVKWNAPIYSDSWSAKRRAALISRIAPIELSVLEPETLEAFLMVDCDNITKENVIAPDFDAKAF